MRTTIAVLLTAIYVSAAIRIGYVECQVEARIERNHVLTPVMWGAAWPFIMLVVGFGTLVSGNPGIYDSAYKHKG